jgi:hypothetical protein
MVLSLLAPLLLFLLLLPPSLPMTYTHNALVCDPATSGTDCTYEINMHCVGHREGGSFTTGDAVALNQAICCNLGPDTCLDKGIGFASNGGALTVEIVAAYNLPNSDGFGEAGGTTDAFVTVTVGR